MLNKNTVLQCGFPRSGNYFLWKLLSRCQKKLGIFSSYLHKSGLGNVLKYIYASKRGFRLHEDFYEIDDVRINGSELTLGNIDNLKPFPVNVDEELLVYSSTIIWTHSTPSSAIKLILRIPVRFYLVRDGRDVINSLIHATCADVGRKGSIYKIKEVNKVYDRLDIVRSYIERWNNHVRDFLKFERLFILLKYENLVNFDSDFVFILKLFGLNDRKNIEYFKEVLSFDKMKKETPGHLRKGKNGDWKNYFSEVHKEIFKEIAGETLIKLGYEKDMNW